jgi:nicotinamidase-related amidase
MTVVPEVRRLGARPSNAWAVSRETVDMSRPPVAPRPLRLEATPQNLVIDAGRTAAIVIDMQNDFCTPGGWLDHIGVDVMPARAPIAPLQRLLPALRAAAMPVIWLNWGNRPDRLNLSPALLHVYNPTGDGVGLGDPLPSSGARVLEKDSWAAAVVDELAPAAEDIRIDKYRMSGFWDTPLDSVLRTLNLSTLLFAGVNADQCVLATLMDANFLGYDCLLLEDCTATTSPEFCLQATLYNVRQCFGFVTSSAAVLTALSREEGR